MSRELLRASQDMGETQRAAQERQAALNEANAGDGSAVNQLFQQAQAESQPTQSDQSESSFAEESPDASLTQLQGTNPSSSNSSSSPSSSARAPEPAAAPSNPQTTPPVNSSASGDAGMVPRPGPQMMPMGAPTRGQRFSVMGQEGKTIESADFSSSAATDRSGSNPTSSTISHSINDIPSVSLEIEGLAGVVPVEMIRPKSSSEVGDLAESAVSPDPLGEAIVSGGSINLAAARRAAAAKANEAGEVAENSEAVAANDNTLNEIFAGLTGIEGGDAIINELKEALAARGVEEADLDQAGLAALGQEAATLLRGKEHNELADSLQAYLADLPGVEEESKNFVEKAGDAIDEVDENVGRVTSLADTVKNAVGIGEDVADKIDGIGADTIKASQDRITKSKTRTEDYIKNEGDRDLGDISIEKSEGKVTDVLADMEVSGNSNFGESFKTTAQQNPVGPNGPANQSLGQGSIRDFTNRARRGLTV